MVTKPNRSPVTIWMLRAPGPDRYPNGYVLTADDDEIRVTYFLAENYPQTMFLTRRDARLMAKRINQCLDGTVKR